MIETTKINDNIFLHYIPMKKLKTTTVGLYIHRAVNEEEASKNAVLPYVMRRGCRICDDGEKIAKYLQNLYGAVFSAYISKSGSSQILCFDAESISDKYAPENEHLTLSLLDLLLSSVFEPAVENDAFKADIVAQEKANMKDRIAGLINDKRSYASWRCIEEMCKGEPEGINKYGSIESVERIDEKSLYLYYRKIITSSVIDIYICGDTDIEAVKEKIKDYTEKLQFTKAEIAKNVSKKQSGEIKKVTDRMDITQGKLSIGFRTNTLMSDKDYYSLVVANSIFGGGAHSKLFNNVREKLSLAYYASSSLRKQSGLMVVNAGIEFENFQKAYDEIITQLENVKNGDISKTEFDSAVNAIINLLESLNDDQFYMISWYLGQRAAGVENSIDYVKKQIQNVTLDDVKAAANKTELDTVYFLCGKEVN